MTSAKSILRIAAPCILILATTPAWAAGGTPSHTATAAPSSTAAAAPDADGEVRKIDKSAGTVTLKHGDIPSLDMMGMTMVFKVRDRAMLDAVKVGARVRFRAERQGGSLVITQWSAQP